jgi:polyisoprenyl-teichoic acid--peptidoglycan teichoic acid transferase
MAKKRKDDNDLDFEQITHDYYQPPRRADEAPIERAPKRRKSPLRKLIILIITVFALIVIWTAVSVSYATNKLFDSSVLGYIPTQSLDADSNDRTNILLIGYSIDRKDGGGGGDLTDTILILSLDKQSNDAFMLSVPRDLYVNMGGFGYGRINEAYQIGERNSFQQDGYSEGGVGLVEKTVEEVTGLESHYHAIVNYNSVLEIVDALGGITVNIESPDPRGLYDPNFQPEEGGPLQLENGEQRIDGETALKLVRARGSAGGYGFPLSDFNRTENQQKVVIGIKNELSWTSILNPRQNQLMINAVANNVETNTPIANAIPLARSIMRVNTEEIRSYTLRDIDGVNLLQGITTSGGASVLIPATGVENFTQIQQAIQEISTNF